MEKELNKLASGQTEVELSGAKSADRIATIQRSAMFRLSQQREQIAHLMSITNQATGSIFTLKNSDKMSGEVRSLSDIPAPEPDRPEYDGGATAALDALICACADRLERIVRDDSRWGFKHVDEIEQNLHEWSLYEKYSAVYQAKMAKLYLRPSVYMQARLVQGPNGSWIAVSNGPDGKQLAGVGSSPEAACADFDRVFETGETRNVSVEPQKKGSKCRKQPKSAGLKTK